MVLLVVVGRRGSGPTHTFVVFVDIVLHRANLLAGPCQNSDGV